MQARSSIVVARHLDFDTAIVMTKLCLLLCVLVACAERDDWFRYNWAFGCPDGTYLICRDEGYFHCESGPPIYNPPPPCTWVSARCTSDPAPGQSESQAACFAKPTPLACTAIANEEVCLARPDCTPSYEGIDCTNPTGTMCHGGDSGCTCTQFVFASCVAS
jgi:hypothetical protein